MERNEYAEACSTAYVTCESGRASLITHTLHPLLLLLLFQFYLLKSIRHLMPEIFVWFL